MNPPAAIIYERIGPTWCILLGCIISLTGILVSSFCTNFSLFVFFYAVFFGVGMGLSYMSPLMCGWEHYPDRKGLVSGVIISAFGFTSFFFDILSTLIVNPDDVKPTIEVVTGETTQYFYGSEVADRSPLMLRILVGCWLILSILALFLVRQPRKLEYAEQHNENDNAAVL